MLTLPLEATDDRASPAFKNASACKKWLKQLPLANFSATQAALRTQLDEFNRYPLRGLDRLQTLELLRDTVHEVQEESVKQLANKPLPLNDTELVMLTSITGLWQSLAAGYQRCLLAYEEGDRKLEPYGALLCHRCLMYSGRQIFEYLRAGYEFDGEQWRQFHAVYLFAEEDGLLSVDVEDEFSEHGHVTTCRYIYLKTLFACHARPQELTLHQQELLNQWLAQWIDTFAIERTCTVSRGDAPPLAIDPASTHGLQPFRPEFLEIGNMRYLPMVPVSKLLRVKTILLQQGQTPKQLDLGEEHDRLDCIQLLTHLHRQWCEPRRQRMAERRESGAEMLVRYGVEESYSWIAGQPFNPLQPGPAMPPETWRAEDLSLLGTRLLRIGPSGARVGIKQLVAVGAAAAHRIGEIVWVSIMRTGQMHMGIRFLPGAPQAATVRASALQPGAPPGKFAPALLLSAVPSLSIPASLLMPRGLFIADRVFEMTVAKGEKQRIRLKYSVESGVDYERVSFLPE